MTDLFEPGRIIWYRAYFGSALGQLVPARVVRHDETGLLVWVAPATPVWRLVAPDGRALRDVAREEWPTEQVPAEWTGNGILQWMPSRGDHAVWWFWRPDEPTGTATFRGWYVNLERHVVWVDGADAGIDVVDQELDGEFSPDRVWTWKDEESFADKTGHPAFWDAAEARAVRAEGERLRVLAESGAAPFDGRWCDFAPDPSWPLPERPAVGWDREPALPLTLSASVPDAIDSVR